MVTKLVQKHLLKGTQEFEIIDDAIHVRIKSRFKEESLTVMLAVLNSEPVISKSRLEFTSRVNNEPLLSFYLAKPDAETFNAFVNNLKQKVQDEFHAFAGLKPVMPPGLGGNVFEEPPEFETSGDTPVTKPKKPVRVGDVEDSIRMLSEYIGTDEIRPLLAALEGLQADPQSDAQLSRVASEFEALGPNQGAVLTYAPYIGILLADDPFSY
ncbi:MAG: hypothetical protein PVG66_00550 [Chromatiales bacterium]|jgi:hypothetical protein